jgi:type IV pilus assembly protein PilB
MSPSSEPAIDPRLIQLLPAQSAREFLALPLRKEGQVIVLAMREGHDLETEADLAFVLGAPVRVEPWEKDALREAIDEVYGAEPEPSALITANGTEEEKEAPSFLPNASSGSAVSVVNDLVSRAIKTGASDIHIEPYEKFLRVRYRLDGVLHEVQRLSPLEAKAVISRVKIMADLDIAEKRRPQDGRIRVKEGDRFIDIRVSSLPTDFGEKLVLRILDKNQLNLDLEKLGFEAPDLKLLQRTLKLPYGMILVTGPTGSGKTTTLYAALNAINRQEVNITTIEDPIEYNLPGINQTHVRSDIGVTFAAALRSILRQDPNVIMVGEIRDGETAEIAIRAALTGHLVLSTLHTNDAPSAITRLTDMGIEPFLVAASVKMILAQRLLRRICPECKTVADATSEQREEIALKSSRGFVNGIGCPSCNGTGYRGRTAVYEMLPIQNGLSDMISRGVTLGEMRAKAEANGLTTLRQAGLKKALACETSLKEVLRET